MVESIRQKLADYQAQLRKTRRRAMIAGIVRRALEEDIGTGDVTTFACVPEAQQASGRFLAREELVVAGLQVLRPIYDERGGVDELKLLKRDGDRCVDGETIATVRGRARTLLECERVALNFLQRLSGVATSRAPVTPRPWRARAAACSIRARPLRACGCWRRWPRTRAGRPTTAWDCSTRC